jgi:predicted nucleic acid-binding Zn ribbon protein
MLCPSCSCEFSPKALNQVYCSRKCSRREEKRRARQRSSISPTGKVIECKICSSKFIKQTNSSKYCSDECRSVARRLYVTRAKSKKKDPVGRICIECGRLFLATKGNRICSKECTSLRAKNRYYQSNYGMSLDEYKQKSELQLSRCAICLKEANLVVDHCHETGRTRGLLCPLCNSALGLFMDDPGSLSKAIEYLKKD